MCSAATHDVSYDSPRHYAGVARIGKVGLVRPAKSVNLQVTDGGSHVKTCSDQADGNVEKDRVTINEEKGENPRGGRTCR